MTLAQIEELKDRLVARYGNTVVFEYVFRPSLPRKLAPRPYFHPVRTLRGEIVTGHQPADHKWHLGLAYSWPVVSTWNLWGGPTFVRDGGYQEVENHGEIRHASWISGTEELEWIDGQGEMIAGERRVVGAPEIDESAQAWSLDLDSEIRNTGRRPLRFGSPTTEGRPLAGYAGLAWRGTDAMRGARVLFDDTEPGGEDMGRRSRWFACTGSDATVAIAEHPGNPRVPNRWFVRTDEYLLVTSSPVFDNALTVEPGRSLRMRHRLLVANGVWSAERLGSELNAWAVTAR